MTKMKKGSKRTRESSRADLGDRNEDSGSIRFPTISRSCPHGDVRDRLLRVARPLFALDLRQGLPSHEDDVRLRSFPKIYEVVINTNPAYGFLLETNTPLQNKMVIAHVLGHVDFFKNNAYFSKTNRRMVESAPRTRRLIGLRVQARPQESSRRFLDAVLGDRRARRSELLHQARDPLMKREATRRVIAREEGLTTISGILNARFGRVRRPEVT